MQLDMSTMQANAADAEALLKQLANRSRLMILCALLEEELCVSDLNQRIPLSQSALSQHLATLREAKLVATRRESQTIYYRVVDSRVEVVLGALYNIFCKPE